MENKGLTEIEGKNLWTQARAQLERVLPSDIFTRWISVISFQATEGDTFVLRVPNDYYQSWVEENYMDKICCSLAASAGRDYKVRFVFEAPPPPPSAPSRVTPEPVKKKNAYNAPELRPEYTFDHYVVGPSNNFAHAAALAVAQAPGTAYNPLFMYGGTALGKTHLMQAIGHQNIRHGRLKVSYITCEMLMNEYVESLQKKTTIEFRKKYRNMDVLLIDDIHFLAKSESLQEEIFHTFNDLYSHRKQIVLTSDRPASELKGLEERLVSRFEGGMVTSIEPPNVETRIAIIRKKLAERGGYLPDELILFIAERIRTNIRHLEGALINLLGYTSLHGTPPTLEEAAQRLHHLLDRETSTAVGIDLIQRTVAEFFDLRLADMTSKQRPQSVAWPRQIAMYLCRDLTTRSYPEIGNAFSRNHATAIHAYTLVEKKMREDSNLRRTIQTIRQKLGVSS